jgi:hypothetical protein
VKKGDKLPVLVGGVHVGFAEIEHVGESQVTVFTPAMRSVLGIRTEIDNTPPPAAEPTTETVITGADRAETVETPTPVETPPVVPAETVEPKATEAAAANETTAEHDTSLVDSTEV